MVGESGLGSRCSVEKDWVAVPLPQAAVGSCSQSRAWRCPHQHGTRFLRRREHGNSVQSFNALNGCEIAFWEINKGDNCVAFLPSF